ncbi:MAG: amidohydrolase family protein [Rhizobiales bacterium]|nr:amidohydrolase family protein [Hyphomicrobiales bacterium]
MSRIITCAAILDRSGVARGPSRITLDGAVIAGVEPLPPGAPHDDLLVMPALANAHDHGRPIRTSSIGGFARPLETWLHRLRLFAPVDAHLAALAPFGRAALGGQGAVMVHYTGVQGLTDYVTEARAVARAAGDVGLRIAFGIAMRNTNPLVYGDSGPILAALSEEARADITARFLTPPLSVAEQMARVDAVAEAIASDMVDVQYGPNGVQWATPDLLEAIAAASAATGRRVHMHLLETRYQRAYADQHFPRGIARHLRDIGLLSPRLTLAHCTWANPEDLAIIAESGATISVNTSSNLALRSGLAPVAAMLKAGCKVGIGIDGQAFDEDDDLIREMRLVWSLHGGWGFDIEVTPADVMQAVFANGHATLSSPVTGRIEAGAPADLLLLDRTALDEDALMPVAPADLLFSRGSARHLAESIVAGRSIVRDGRVTGIDLDAVQAELRAALRAGMPSREGFRCVLPELETAICDHFTDRLGCC